MKDIHFGQLDFRHLMILETMLSARSVTRTAERLGMSQSRVSHALARLRLLVGDPLFVLSGAEMLPTPRAEQLGRAGAEAISRMRTAVAPSGEFMPQSCRETFAIATNDFVSFSVLPRLLPQLSALAPGVRLRLSGLDGVSDWRRLEDGSLDLAVAFFRAIPERLKARRIYSDRHVVIMRRDHPLSGQRMSMTAFVEADHIVVNPYITGVIDERLARSGLERHVALALPSTALLPELLSRTDCIATVASRVAEAMLQRHPLVVAPLPFEAKPFRVSMVWHPRRHHAVAQQWLRQFFAECARKMMAY
jgi:DNA-binding transcriptional LysR family regulator